MGLNFIIIKIDRFEPEYLRNHAFAKTSIHDFESKNSNNYIGAIISSQIIAVKNHGSQTRYRL